MSRFFADTVEVDDATEDLQGIAEAIDGALVPLAILLDAIHGITDLEVSMTIGDTYLTFPVDIEGWTLH